MVDIRDLPPPPADVRIPYGRDVFQFGELRVPDGNGPHPLAIVIHGGFWRSMYDLKHTGHLCAALTRDGIATWNLEYRRVGNSGGGWPGTFEDVVGGVQHARAIAEPYNLDTSRVTVLGHSAGGHLALWLGSQARQLSSDSFRIFHVVALAPVADLRRAWELRLGDQIVGEFLGGSPAEIPDRYDEASPIDRLPFGISQTLIHGTRDEKVPYEISDRYVATAKAGGDNATLITLEGAGHFEIIDPRAKEFSYVRDAVVACYNRSV